MEITIQGEDKPFSKEHDLQTMEGLKVFIRHHNNLYYNGEAEISDEEYDLYFRYLQRLEFKYPETVNSESPTQTVGAKV